MDQSRVERRPRKDEEAKGKDVKGGKTAVLVKLTKCRTLKLKVVDCEWRSEDETVKEKKREVIVMGQIKGVCISKREEGKGRKKSANNHLLEGESTGG